MCVCEVYKQSFFSNIKYFYRSFEVDVRNPNVMDR